MTQHKVAGLVSLFRSAHANFQIRVPIQRSSGANFYTSEHHWELRLYRDRNREHDCVLNGELKRGVASFTKTLLQLDRWHTGTIKDCVPRSSLFTLSTYRLEQRFAYRKLRKLHTLRSIEKHEIEALRYLTSNQSKLEREWSKCQLKAAEFHKSMGSARIDLLHIRYVLALAEFRNTLD